MNDFSPLLRCSLAVFVLGAALSCELDAPTVHDADAPTFEESAAVTIRFRDDSPEIGAPRTIVPPTSTIIASYELSAAGPEGAMLNFQSRDPWINAQLTSGVWDLVVRGLNGSGAVLLVGVGAVTVEPGVAASVEIGLSPCTGFGSCRIVPLVPPVAEGATLEIEMRSMDGREPIPGTKRTLTEPFPTVLYTEVSSGYVLCAARLKDPAGTVLSGIVEAVRILPDTETAFTLDFASIPGSVSFALIGGSVEPLVPELPCWSALPGDRQVPAEVSGVASGTASGTAGETVSWFVDAAPVVLDEDSLPSGLATGVRRLDVVAQSADLDAAGSSSRSFEVLPGVADGSWAWAATFAPPVRMTDGLPLTHGFVDLAASADGRVLVALDAPAPGIGASGNAAASALFRFSVTERGSLFEEDVVPVRSGGSLRSCDRLALSADGAVSAAYSVGSSWLALESRAPDGSASFVHVDAASLHVEKAFSVKDALFAENGACLLVLVGPAPYRVIAINVGTVPTLRWTFTLEDPSIVSLTFGSMTMASDGSLLLLAGVGDAAALLRPLAGHGFSQAPVTAGSLKRTSVGPAWLDGPCDAVPRDGGFDVLCADSGAIGFLRMTEAGLVAEGQFEAAPPGVSRIALSSDASAVALCGSAATPPLPLCLDSAAFAPSSRGDAPAHPAACAWSGSRLIVADAAKRRLSCFVRDE